MEILLSLEDHYKWFGSCLTILHCLLYIFHQWNVHFLSWTVTSTFCVGRLTSTTLISVTMYKCLKLSLHTNSGIRIVHIQYWIIIHQFLNIFTLKQYTPVLLLRIMYIVFCIPTTLAKLYTLIAVHDVHLNEDDNAPPDWQFKNIIKVSTNNCNMH